MLFNCNRRTASFTRLLLFSSACNSSYGSSIEFSADAADFLLLLKWWLLLFVLFDFVVVWWSQVVDDSPLHERHGMWYGDGRELRFVRVGFALSRRFSLISCTNSSMANTSLACLLGIVDCAQMSLALLEYFARGLSRCSSVGDRFCFFLLLLLVLLPRIKFCVDDAKTKRSKNRFWTFRCLFCFFVSVCLFQLGTVMLWLLFTLVVAACLRRRLFSFSFDKEYSSWCFVVFLSAKSKQPVY